MKNFLPLTRVLALPALVLVLSVLTIALPEHPAAAQQVLDYHVYLPIVMRNADSTQVTPTPMFLSNEKPTTLITKNHPPEQY